MRAVLLALVLLGAAASALPLAAASPPCQDENPCDPAPMSLCHGTEPDKTKYPTAWAKWFLGCL